MITILQKLNDFLCLFLFDYQVGLNQCKKLIATKGRRYDVSPLFFSGNWFFINMPISCSDIKFFGKPFFQKWACICNLNLHNESHFLFASSSITNSTFSVNNSGYIRQNSRTQFRRINLLAIMCFLRLSFLTTFYRAIFRPVAIRIKSGWVHKKMFMTDFANSFYLWFCSSIFSRARKRAIYLVFRRWPNFKFLSTFRTDFCDFWFCVCNLGIAGIVTTRTNFGTKRFLVLSQPFSTLFAIFHKTKLHHQRADVNRKGGYYEK